MNLTQVMQSINMEELIDKLNAYAISRLKSVGIKTFNGVEPVDFVGEVLLKVIDEGGRDWSKAKCSFKEFLFGCLKSEISNFFSTSKNTYSGDLPDSSSDVQPSNIEEKRRRVSELLKQEGADDDELTVFECWMDGMLKPSEIAKDLGIDVKDVYNITKRLERRMPKIQAQVLDIV